MRYTQSFYNRSFTVTLDGSSYITTNGVNQFIMYDFSHVNSMYKFFVLNRVVESYTLESLYSTYEISLRIDGE